jgi:hypothetical protein
MSGDDEQDHLARFTNKYLDSCARVIEIQVQRTCLSDTYLPGFGWQWQC